MAPRSAGARLGEAVGDGTRRLDAADALHALVERVELRAVLRALQLQLLQPLLQVHQLHLQRELLRLRACHPPEASGPQLVKNAVRDTAASLSCRAAAREVPTVALAV